jgi:hypothetical protein
MEPMTIAGKSEIMIILMFQKTSKATFHFTQGIFGMEVLKDFRFD